MTPRRAQEEPQRQQKKEKKRQKRPLSALYPILIAQFIIAEKSPFLPILFL
jgi:hypothetical protein